MADSVSTEAILSPELIMTPEQVALIRRVTNDLAVVGMADSHEALRAERDNLQRQKDGLEGAIRVRNRERARLEAEARTLREAIEDALGRRQVTHIHAGLRAALAAADTPEATCPPHDFGQDRRWERCARCGADNPEEE